MVKGLDSPAIRKLKKFDFKTGHVPNRRRMHMSMAPDVPHLPQLKVSVSGEFREGQSFDSPLKARPGPRLSHKRNSAHYISIVKDFQPKSKIKFRASFLGGLKSNETSPTHVS